MLAEVAVRLPQGYVVSVEMAAAEVENKQILMDLVLAVQVYFIRL
jgi:hypothetical protein